MKKIRDIICAHTTYGDVYHHDDSLTGKILLASDSSFEGLIEDSNGQETFFIFGNMNKENQSISVIKSTKNDDDLPKEYRVYNENGNFYGDLYVKTRFAEIPIGECKVSVINPDTYREVSPREYKQLKTNIQMYKSSLGEESFGLYQEIMPDTYEKEMTK